MISLEYLMLSLVSLSLLTISAFALLEIKEFSAQQSDLFAFKSSVVVLSNAMNEICALGSGNARSVFLEHELSVESEEDAASFTSSDLSMARETYCEIETAEDLQGLVKIENKDGIIRLR